MHKNLFLTGATGYIGRYPIPELVRRGHTVRALVRPGSERKLVDGATAVLGDALALPLSSQFRWRGRRNTNPRPPA